VSRRLPAPVRVGWAAIIAGVAIATGAAADPDPAGPWRTRVEWRDRATTVESFAQPDGLVGYRFRATEPGHESREREVVESPDRPRSRSGNPLFDGLFALALEEAAADSVNEITDAQFNDGRPIACRCYETGAKWHYAWTRDISYSVDLGLTLLDPERARDSLLFKTSGLRLAPAGEAADRQLVAQDTGSGGSWPVSTDRIAWIHAAMDALHGLSPEQAVAFEPQLRQVARDTLDQDRRYAYDPAAGLYRGETSFLDWREQSYPEWTRNDTRFIAESFALSTNVLHVVALRDAAMLERRAGSGRAAGFDRMASALARRINQRFWRESAGLYAAYIGPDLAPAAIYDLLGLTLAIKYGIADASRAHRVLSQYPVTGAGPPVIWPERRGVPVYHNRALWPFVTAYAFDAARIARDPARMSAYAESLMRGAALALSNMENFEYLTQQTEFEDGALGGPVINSPRQLWSVAAYVGAVARGLFGVAVTADGVEFAPMLPGPLAKRLFSGGGELTLEHLPIRGHLVTLRLRLPSSWSESDLLVAHSVSVNGVRLAGRELRFAGLPGAAAIEATVDLRPAPGRPSVVTPLEAADPHAPTPGEQSTLLAPRTPSVHDATRDGAAVRIAIDGVDADARWRVYRDGVPRGAGRAGEEFRDDGVDVRRTACYAVTQTTARGGLESLSSPELCLAGPGSRQRFDAATGALESSAARAVAMGDEAPAYRDWGGPGDRLGFSFVPSVDGLQRLRLEYSNASGPVNTGITAAVKRIEARCADSRRAPPGVIVMPHLPDHVVGWSTEYVFEARQGKRCRIEIVDGVNMSYLEHFHLYTGGRGGRDGPLNRANVVAAQVDAIARPRLGPR